MYSGKNRKFVFISGFLLFLCGFFQVSCDRKKDIDGGQYRVPLNTIPKSLDPSLGDSAESMQISSLMYSTLLRSEPNGKIINHLVSKWSHNKSLTEYDFYIRPNVFFHDGSKLQCEDIIFSLERLKQDQSLYKDFIDIISDITSQPEKNYLCKLKITLKKPFQSFPLTLAMPGFSIVKKSQENKKECDCTVGTGPYKFDGISEDNTKITFSAFENYFKNDPKIKKVVLMKVDNTEEALGLIKKGVIHHTNDSFFSDEQLELYGYRKVFFSEMRVFYIGFNTLRYPFSNLAFRKAIYHILDFSGLENHIAKYDGLRLTSNYIPKGMLGYDPQIRKKIATEKEILDFLSRSKINIAEMEPIVFAYNPPKPAAEFILRKIRDAFSKYNIPIKIMSNWTDLSSTHPTKNIDFFLLSTAPNVPDPYFMLNYQRTRKEKFEGFTGYSNPMFDKHLDIYSSLGYASTEERIEVLRILNRYLIDDYVVLPLYQGSANLAYFKKNIRGIQLPFVNFMFPWIEELSIN
ncbi:MAG: ABC transporter substrate-binding protein [Bdellovibrionota bacterium]